MPPTARKTNPAKKIAPSAAPADPPEMPQPPEDKYAPTAWGSSEFDGSPQDLTVPSGQTCLVRRPGVEALLREGVLFESDILTTMIHENIQEVERGRPQKPVDMEALMSDPKKFDDLMTTTDKVVCAVVLKPTVQRALNDPTNRKPGIIYTDMIALEDKFAILEFALGGTRTLATFREEPPAGVGSVRPRKSTRGPAKRTTARKR